MHPTHRTADTPPRKTVGWLAGYRRFLLSRDESLVLKLAPLALLGLLPPEILSNLIPGIGLLDDVGYVIVLLYVLGTTIRRVTCYWAGLRG